MPAKALVFPPVGEPVETIVDWLELEAFLSPFCIASVDDAISCQEFQAQDAENDIGERDRLEEDARAEIELEVRFRSNSLAATYPFSLTGDGEELIFDEEKFADASSVYLLCLILSHITRSPILLAPPRADLVRQARKRLFQIVATLAAAGHAEGGAVSLGWPREKSESIIQVVSRAAQNSGTGAARASPHQLEPKGAKDGGLDVLAWKVAPDGPPPEAFYFVQAASGLNWIAKSAESDYKQFLTCYFDTYPSCNYSFLTVCPFRLSSDAKTYHQISHGAISDRTRAPIKVLAAIEAAANGVAIDEVENLPLIAKWLARYRRENRADR